jgi:hypothetical protein
VNRVLGRPRGIRIGEEPDRDADEVKHLERLLAELRDFHLSITITSKKVNIEELLLETLTMVGEDYSEKNIHTDLYIDKKARPVAGD